MTSAAKLLSKRAMDLADEVAGLKGDLRSAVEVAWNRGATEWVKLNYPRDAERLLRGAER